MILKKYNIECKFIKGNSENKINLVFIHGSGCNKDFLHALANQMKEYDCYLLDLPGHGGSDNTGYNIENYVESISNFVKDLDNVILIGHSLGGTLALSISSKNIPNIEGNVIISSAAKFSKLDKEFMIKIHKGLVDMNYLMQCAGKTSDPLAIEALNSMNSEELIIKDFIIDEMVDFEYCLKNIDIPTLIITGSDEILALVEYSEYLYKNIKNSKITIIPNERHLLPITKKEDISKLIKDLIISIGN